MRLSRFARVTAAAAALALTAVACGGDEGTVESEGEGSVSGTGSASTPAETDGEMAADIEVVNEGQLTVCSDIPYAPFEFEKEDGSGYTGFDIELMEAIAADLGLELNVVATGFDPIQSGTALAAGECDVAASAMTITEEREENLDFSEPYYDAEQSLAAADESITTLEDLSGKRLGVQSATTGEIYAQENAPEDAEIVSFENPGDLFTALSAGDIDAILQDLPVNAEQARKDDSLSVVETYSTGENYGFAVAEEGSDALLEAINVALASLRDDGTYDELFERYFGTE